MKALKVVLPAVAFLFLLVVATRRRAPETTPVAPSPTPVPPPSAPEAPAPAARRLPEELAILQIQPVSTERNRRLRKRVADWAAVDPAAAAAWTLQLPYGWTYTDPDGSLTSESARLTFREIVARIWASRNPAAAAAWVDSLSDEPKHVRPVAAVVIAEWIRLHADGATAWAERIERERRGWSATPAMLEAWADLRPRDAVAWLERRSGSENYAEHVSAFAVHWARTQPRDAAAWAVTLATANRTEVLDRIGSLWRIDDPEGAAAWVAGLPPADQSTSLIRDVANGLSMKNPVAAARWAEHFPDGPQRNTALLATVSSWAPNDPQAAISLLQGLPPEPVRNEEMLRVARRFLELDPASGPILLRQMQIPTGPYEMRSQICLEQLFEKWAAIDRETAVSWANETSKTPGGRALKSALKRLSAASR